jgi:alpha-N-arabinofuranosidase
MKNTLTIYPLLSNSIEIMDQFDPRGRIGLFVDEWGTWWDAEPGTNRSFLYQQNTLRDAVSCGIFLNAFNSNCRRVRMANIAQTNNVLQAMILTKGEKMIVTPTYHVFEMYKVHQDATLLPVELECGNYRFGDEIVPAINVSASKDNSGKIHVSLCNLDPENSVEIDCKVQGAGADKVSGRVLTADAMAAHNTFDAPQAVRPAKFNGFKLDGDILTMTLPSKSVVVLEIE